MDFYAAGVKPMINHLAGSVNKEDCMQAWYANDSSAAGKLNEVKLWWQQLNQHGPKFGYYPKASKSVLILKKQSLLHEARRIFADTNIEITCQGERHLGAVIGHEDYKSQYVAEKVKKWTQDIKDLAEIGKDEPQAALSAYVKSMSHRWTFVQRTIPGTKHLFEPLEKCIRCFYSLHCWKKCL